MNLAETLSILYSRNISSDFGRCFRRSKNKAFGMNPRDRCQRVSSDLSPDMSHSLVYATRQDDQERVAYQVGNRKT